MTRTDDWVTVADGLEPRARCALSAEHEQELHPPASFTTARLRITSGAVLRPVSAARRDSPAATDLHPQLIELGILDVEATARQPASMRLGAVLHDSIRA
jgi:hypothetical protein